MGRGTAAADGGGGILPLGAEPYDGTADGGRVGENVCCGDAKHPYPLCFDPSVAFFIARRSVAHVVGYAVDFDTEL